ncbi:MAG TPA: methyltransferase domain-containing protein [Aquella sp.]|nr:methyltransferase domain-containing protein [Aquella sp.]
MVKNDSSEAKHDLETEIFDCSKIHDFQIVLTGEGKKVLEICSQSGSISENLTRQKCHVTVIEINESMNKQVEKLGNKIKVNNIETLKLKEILGAEKYDVILINNVLQRLRKPTEFLKQLHELVTDNSCIVCSVPNFLNIINRIKFLNGEFKYEQNGLIDDNHLRFFTLDTILSMIDESGYSITKLYRVKEKIDIFNRTDLNYYSIPEELIKSILRDVESATFHFVFSAVPTADKNLNITKKWLREFPNTITTDKLKEIFQYYKENYGGVLHKTLQERDSRIAELESVIKERDTRIAELESVIKERDAQVSMLRGMLEDIRQSRTWKMLKKYDNSIGKIISKIKKNNQDGF